MINKFLSGKKKYSVFITTFLVAAIEMFTGDPAVQKTLTDFVPMLAMMLSGITYIVVQGMRDLQHEKTCTEAAKAKNSSYSLPGYGLDAPQPAKAQPAQPQQEIKPIESAIEAFDIKAFHERVLNDVEMKYTKANPATIFYQARDKGSVTTAYSLEQAKDYWDYLVTLSHDALAYVQETTTDKKDPCRRTSPEYLLAQRDVAKTLDYRQDVHELANTNIDWKRKLGPNDTLYHVGVLAKELLRHNI